MGGGSEVSGPGPVPALRGLDPGTQIQCPLIPGGRDLGADGDRGGPSRAEPASAPRAPEGAFVCSDTQMQACAVETAGAPALAPGLCAARGVEVVLRTDPCSWGAQGVLAPAGGSPSLRGLRLCSFSAPQGPPGLPGVKVSEHPPHEGVPVSQGLGVAGAHCGRPEAHGK